MFFRLIPIIFFLFIILPHAVSADEAYPRLANYFLKWEMTEADAVALARWDLVILDMENQENNPELIKKIRELNPDVKIFAYITSQEILDDTEEYRNAYLRQRLSEQIINAWRLKDAAGASVVNWPYTTMLNLSNEAGRNANGQRFNEFLPYFIRDNIQSSGLWDGVFYDNIWGDVAWVNGGNLDFNNDGIKESSVVANSLWVEGTLKLLLLTRELCGRNFMIIGNGRVHWPYQPLLNGMMLEAFPSSWENGGTWAGSMASYAKLSEGGALPALPIINIYEKDQANYQLVRYGLTSALLGDGYFSFDYDVSNHGQTWWYDEYDVNLGTAESAPYNLLNPQVNSWQPGLWRRDFKNGVAIVNSSDKVQNFSFTKEEFEKIKGIQAPLINNGLKINYLSLKPRDGIVLLKKISAWQGSVFTNGGFLRIFKVDGQQARNGFFSYVSSLPAGGEVLVGDFFEGKTDYIFSNQGKISRQRGGKVLWTIQPFAAGFKGRIAINIGDINGDGQPEIIIGAGPGGGPQVRVYDFNGRPLLNFFAYDKNFRGGVNVAAGDINGDGRAEIITGAGPGGGPHVRYFNNKGELVDQFFAYDKNFRGGVNVAAGDINGDGRAEIITGAGPGGGPQVRIFSGAGRALSSFFAYDQNFRGGISVGFSKESGNPEIAVGIKGF